MWFSNKLCMAIHESDRSIYFINVARLSAKSENKGIYYPLHAHEWYEAVFCTKGSGTVTIHATTFVLCEGMALLIRPNTFHSFFGEQSSDFEYCVLGFYVDPAMEIASKLASPNVLADISEFLPSVSANFDLIYTVHGNGDYHDHPLFFSICLELVYLIMYQLQRQPLDLPIVKNNMTDQILDFIHYHYQEDISLDTISKKFSISVPHLSRLFKNAYNTSLINYLIDYRFCVARDYLSHSDLPVKDICLLVGYENVGHFCKLFEKRTGYSPNEYRKLKNSTQPASDLPLNLVKRMLEKRTF